MAWTVNYIDELEVVELTISGEFTDEDIKAAAYARIAMGKEHGVTHFIIDAVEMDLTGTTFSIYDVPARIYSEENMQRKSRIAVITSPDSASRNIAEFFENVSVNRGWNAKVFVERKDAIEWLQKKRSPAED
ncbi:MAG: STAS/SEC14 domain-containing protein [Gammaproteobacteria bacterium]|nr:STAS/SEC14 domain-containing protein [Gammaproteobacteria bacterium]MDH3433107.1 STAS/SEC14 domain-containing protein [Gammaproteobacteria bacterium]